ncbi:MAG: hemolysin family protein [Bacteroidota bacterium]
MDSLWLDIFVIVTFIFLSAFFAAAEIAVISLRRTRIQELIEQKNKNAVAVKELLSDPDRFFAIVQIGMTVFPAAASALSGVLAIKYLKPALGGIPFLAPSAETVAVGIVIVLVSYFTLVVGELAPKSLGLRYAEVIALLSARILKGLLRISSVIISFLSGSTNLALRPFKDRTSFIEPRISEEEFKLMLDEGRKSGVIDKVEHELIDRIFEFTDTRAKEVMVPRTDVVAIEMKTSHERLIKVVTEEGYSRMPVYVDTIDHIVGIIYTKDLITLLENRDLIVLEDIIRPAYFVPNSKKISQLMREFQLKKIHLAIVVDEFGGTEGIITMEDILEEIVGEIHDEYDEVLKEVEASADGSFLVNARVPISQFNERFGCDIPEDADYETVGGFLYKLTGRIPDLNETISHKNLTFTVATKSDRRMRQIKVRKIPESTSSGNVEAPQR